MELLRGPDGKKETKQKGEKDALHGRVSLSYSSLLDSFWADLHVRPKRNHRGKNRVKAKEVQTLFRSFSLYLNKQKMLITLQGRHPL